MEQPKTIAIIGGGITGLAAAFRAERLFPDAEIELFEASDSVGGVLQTEHFDPFVIEQSADMFVTDPPFAWDLVEQLGKTDELIQTKPTRDRAFVATANSMHPVPRGLSLMLPNDVDSILASPLLDDAAKARFLEERNVPPRESNEDESLESFAVRRFGKSVFQQLIQPLVSGIYTADPKKLSMNATMSRFVKMERDYGSLIVAAEKSKSSTNEKEASGARYGLFRAPKNGMGQLVQWITESFTRTQIRTSSTVGSLSKSDSKWCFNVEQNGELTAHQSDAIVIATPARVAGEIIEDIDSQLAQKISSIQTASSAIVVLGVDQAQLSDDSKPDSSFEGYGIIVPAVLGRKVIATSLSSNKFAGRAPDGKYLIRTFIGGALQSELVELSDDELIKIATNELQLTVGFKGSPEMALSLIHI